eukprot:COSAG01_NODE_2302_length_7952_cov_8.079078_3_plen_218_part_00
MAEPNPTMHQPGCQAALLHASDGCSYLSGPGTRHSEPLAVSILESVHIDCDLPTSRLFLSRNTEGGSGRAGHDEHSPLHGGWCHGPRSPEGARIPGRFSTCGRFNGVLSRSSDGGVSWLPVLNVSAGEEFGALAPASSTALLGHGARSQRGVAPLPLLTPTRCCRARAWWWRCARVKTHAHTVWADRLQLAHPAQRHPPRAAVGRRAVFILESVHID